jgi:hypothetical protein
MVLEAHILQISQSELRVCPPCLVKEESLISIPDIISLYRDHEPWGEIIFDMSFTSARWAVQRRFPLASNCTNSPGKDLVSSVSFIAVLQAADTAQIGVRNLL